MDSDPVEEPSASTLGTSEHSSEEQHVIAKPLTEAMDAEEATAESNSSLPSKGNTITSADEESGAQSPLTQATSHVETLDTAPSSLNFVRPQTPTYIEAPQEAIDQLEAPRLQFDRALESNIKSLINSNAHAQASQRILLAAATEAKYCSPLLIGRVLRELGRQADSVNVIEELYLLAYRLLPSYASTPDQQMMSWIQLEDDALISMANFGLLDRVAQHRDRLVAAGAAPSADAYGAMILNAHDTTDDATVAVELFEESRSLGVKPNTFLFNNLISRLSKARRATAVLECFEQMKAAGVLPSAVTYGAVINAVSTMSTACAQLILTPAIGIVL